MKLPTHTKLMTIVVLTLLVSHQDLIACYSISVSGPDVICPNAQASYYVGGANGFTCNSWAEVNWNLVGDGGFYDNNGNYIGKSLICGNGPNSQFPCPSQGQVHVMGFGGTPTIVLQVQATCSAIGSATSSKTINVGLPPPASITGFPTEACSGSTFTVTAAPVNGAYSYTWRVPNSSWLIGGNPGPSVTFIQAGPLLYPNVTTITVGNTSGQSTFSVGANLQACTGYAASAALNTYTSGPGTPGKIFFDGNCINTGITISCGAVANATLYFLQVFDGGYQIFNGLSSTPYFNFIPTYPSSYTVWITPSNACGAGGTKQAILNAVDCGGGGGGGIQRMSINMSPNPAKGHVNVKLFPNHDAKILNEITDEAFTNADLEITIFSTIDGSQVYTNSTKEKSFQIDISHLHDTRYILIAKTCGETLVRQLVVGK